MRNAPGDRLRTPRDQEEIDVTNRIRSRMVALALVATSIGCSAPTLVGTARYGTFEPVGDFGISAGGASGAADVEEAGFDRDDSVPSASVDLKWGLPHVTVSALTSSFRGNGSLDADISQGGITIPAGSMVRSEMDLDVYSGVITFDVLPTDFELGLGFGAGGFDLDAQITERTTGASVATEEIVGLPVLAARAGGRLGDFRASALLSASKFKYDDFDADLYYDLDLQASYSFLGGRNVRAALAVGYRQIGIDADYDDGDDRVDVDLELRGPWIGLEIGI